MTRSLSVLGAGAFGTALAATAVRAGREVILYSRNRSVADEIADHQENKTYLPGIHLPEIPVTAELELACQTDTILLAVPAQSMRAVLIEAMPYTAKTACLVSCAKGLETGTGMRMSEVIGDIQPQAAAAVLSGPGFAIDVAAGRPTAITIAAEDDMLAQQLCQALSTPTFRPYAGTDMVGVEIGGAVKNVLAIAAGIVDGRGLGASALAALIARSFAELRRMGRCLGAMDETLMGLSGLGDLVLTCSNAQSRNFSFGRMLGSGGDLDQPHPLVEGIATARVTLDLASSHDIAMPIVGAVVDILSRQLTIDGAIEQLMSRPLTFEANEPSKD